MPRGRQARPVPVWWGEVRDGFLRSLRRRNRRPKTENAYRYELGAFGAWMTEQGVNSLPELLPVHLEAWQDFMLERGLAPRSQIVKISALRGCLKWAAIRELPLSSPTLWLRIESPRVPPLDPRPIPRRDLRIILEELERPEQTDIWAVRTRALFWALFSSGARITEMLSLRRGALDRDGCHVIQKGGRPHVLLFSEHAIAAIEDYDRLRSDDCPMMFASLLPGQLGKAMKRHEAQKSWNQLCRQVQIARFTSHQIRHSCATTLRKRGVDVVLIGKHMGWRGLGMMQNYALVEVEDRQGAVALLDTLLVEVSERQRAVASLDQAIAS